MYKFIGATLTSFTLIGGVIAALLAPRYEENNRNQHLKFQDALNKLTLIQQDSHVNLEQVENIVEIMTDETGAVVNVTFGYTGSQTYLSFASGGHINGNVEIEPTELYVNLEKQGTEDCKETIEIYNSKHGDRTVERYFRFEGFGHLSQEIHDSLPPDQYAYYQEAIERCAEETGLDHYREQISEG